MNQSANSLQISEIFCLNKSNAKITSNDLIRARIHIGTKCLSKTFGASKFMLKENNMVSITSYELGLCSNRYVERLVRKKSRTLFCYSVY